LGLGRVEAGVWIAGDGVGLLLELAYAGCWASENAPACDAVQGDRDSAEGGVEDDRCRDETTSMALPATFVTGRIVRSAAGFAGRRRGSAGPTDIKATMRRTVTMTSTATSDAAGAALVACSRLNRDTYACAISRQSGELVLAQAASTPVFDEPPSLRLAEPPPPGC
jgi:hypothetical protein